MSFLSKIFGNANNKAIKKFESTIDLINQKEKQFNDLSDNELIKHSLNLKKNNDESEIDDLLIESVTCIRESIRRVTGEWAYDVQLLGALTLHEGSIAEMKTGEGKTLVATLALYLNSILGNSGFLFFFKLNPNSTNFLYSSLLYSNLSLIFFISGFAIILNLFVLNRL